MQLTQTVSNHQLKINDLLYCNTFSACDLKMSALTKSLWIRSPAKWLKCKTCSCLSRGEHWWCRQLHLREGCLHRGPALSCCCLPRPVPSLRDQPDFSNTTSTIQHSVIITRLASIARSISSPETWDPATSLYFLPFNPWNLYHLAMPTSAS